MTLNVLKIIEGTSVDGPGLRTSIYLAGCLHACPGCHNPQSWDFNAGTPMTIDEIMQVITCNDAPVTLTGGDPLYHPNEVKQLAQRIAAAGYNLWIYTGFTWEQIKADPQLLSVASLADTIVDGPFILAQRDTTLPFRGSHNQRFIHPKEET